MGLVHVDVKHLPKLRDEDRVNRERCLYAVIDRASRHVRSSVQDDETAASAVASLEGAVAAPPFRAERLSADRGPRFTADGFEAA